MADISNFIDTINRAVRGEEVRDAIIDAIENIANKNSSAGSLNGIDADQFVTKEDLERWNITPLDNQPIEGSTHGVTSGGLYTYLQETLVNKGLMVIIGEKEKQFSSLADIVQYLDDIKAAIRRAIKGKLDSSQAGSLTKDTYFMDYATLIENLQTGATTKLETLTIDSPHEKVNDPYEPSEGYNGFDKVKVKIDFDNYRIKNRKVIGASLEIDEETHLPKETFFKLKDEPEYEKADPDKKPVGYDDFSVDISDKLTEKPIEVDPEQFGLEQTFNAYEDDSAPFGWYKVTIRIKENPGPFTVNFYKDSAKSNLLATVTDVALNQTAYYPGTPSLESVADDGYEFKDWNPRPINVTKNLDCIAVWQKKAKDRRAGEIGKSWAEIAVNGGVDIPIGSWKIITIGGCQSADGKITCPRTKVIIQKVASGEDETTSTWLCRTPIAVSTEMYTTDYTSASKKTTANGYENSDLRAFLTGPFLSALCNAAREDSDGDDAFSAGIKQVRKNFLGFDAGITTDHYEAASSRDTIDSYHVNDSIWAPSMWELSGDSHFKEERSNGKFINGFGTSETTYVDPSSGAFPGWGDDSPPTDLLGTVSTNAWKRTANVLQRYGVAIVKDASNVEWYEFYDNGSRRLSRIKKEESTYQYSNNEIIYEMISMYGTKQSTSAAPTAFAYARSGLEGKWLTDQLMIPLNKAAAQPNIPIKCPIMFGFCT